MKVFITGGLGFVGTKLTDMLIADGNKVTVVGRNPGNRPAPHKNITLIAADATKPGAWQNILAEHETIINLAGVSIFSRWSSQKKQEIWDSRLRITRNIADALKKRKGKKTNLFSASAVGYYGFHGDEELTEGDNTGGDFLARLCRDWEAEAAAAQSYGARVVFTRFGTVLGRGGGAMSILVKLFGLGLGSSLGSGKQWFSWIHEDDLASIFSFLLRKKNVTGAINCTAPNPVTNLELTKVLNQVLRRFPLVPSVPGFMLKAVFGEFGDFLLKGQRVVPKRLLEAGFAFTYPDLTAAIKNIAG